MNKTKEGAVAKRTKMFRMQQLLLIVKKRAGSKLKCNITQAV